MKRSRHLLWLVLLLALGALLSWFQMPREQPATVDALLDRLCTHMDSLTEMKVSVSTQWERRGRTERPETWELKMTSNELVATSRSRYRLECRYLADPSGSMFAIGAFGRGEETRTWLRRPSIRFRETTGAFLGVPTMEDQEHPGKEDGSIPYALGTLVQVDTKRYLMIYVQRSEYRGLQDGLHHLEFFQEGLDWDLWMDDSAKPLPRRLRMRWAPMADGKPGRVLDIRYDWTLPRP